MAKPRGFETETQFFNYHPSELLEDINDATKDFCCDVADTLEKRLKQDIHLTKKSPQQISQEVEKMFEELSRAFKDNFSTFQSYSLQNFFTFPDDIEFESPITPPPNLHIPTQEEEEEIESEIISLRQKHVKLDQEINTAINTRDTLKNDVEIITNMRAKLQALLQDNNNINNINALEKDIQTIITSINTLNKKMSNVETLHQKMQR